MGKTNNLNSHTPESSNSRADKMSGHGNWLKTLRGKSKKFMKHFYSKKRRDFLKNPGNFDKI